MYTLVLNIPCYLCILATKKTWRFRLKPHPTRERFKFHTSRKASCHISFFRGTDDSQILMGCSVGGVEGVDVKLWIDRRIIYQTTTTWLNQGIFLHIARFVNWAALLRIIRCFKRQSSFRFPWCANYTYYIILEEKFRFLSLSARVLRDKKWMWNVCCLL